MQNLPTLPKLTSLTVDSFGYWMKLWHYTSLQGFHGIVKSKAIWATDLRHLNDRQEFIHVRSIVDEAVQESPDEEPSGLRIREALEKLAKATFDAFDR